ncbi:nucleolin [Fusarium proliferatum]|uniref:Nucleolin n=1 Tax=Gibberella intermedia TaxID=948311 RepID=A0A365N3E1_GIBIN|nr:nucleolin [Fusarium proliferatum]KAG4284941.1 nucleolin [Fusarium proliferatum]KAG4294482.1 nucleolin [Fusarium proliferatum]RBA15333.1 nucleolin [Fusarium proliferatum]
MAKTKTKESKAKSSDSSDSESGSGSDSDSDSDDESEEEKPKAKATEKAAEKKADSSDDSDSDDSEDDSDDSDSSDSDEEAGAKIEKTEEAPSKKRKAEDDGDADAKKTKTDEATTLFAGSLSWSIDDNALYEAFKHIEGLANARVMTEKGTGRSRGFGYVDFNDAASCTKAYETMQGVELEGRAINLDYANARPADANPQSRAADRAQRHGDTVSPESDTLFVGNLPFDVDQDTVREFFSDVAEVASVRLPTDPDSGNLKGFGYVSFNSVEDAKQVFEAKNGAPIGNGLIDLGAITLEGPWARGIFIKHLPGVFGFLIKPVFKADTTWASEGFVKPLFGTRLPLSSRHCGVDQVGSRERS